MLIIWLQGIWLPLHGYGFDDDAAVGGHLHAAADRRLPARRRRCRAALSDRFGARSFATGGMLRHRGSFVLLMLLPVDFAYWAFAAILLLNGIGMGLFAAPNRAGDHEQRARRPARRRRGHARDVPERRHGAVDRRLLLPDDRRPGQHPAARAEQRPRPPQGVPAARRDRIAGLPPVAVLFAALLGYNPIQHAARPAVLGQLPGRARPPPDRPELLPAADLRPVRRRAWTARSASRSPPVSSPLLRLLAARRQVRLHGASGGVRAHGERATVSERTPQTRHAAGWGGAAARLRAPGPGHPVRPDAEPAGGAGLILGKQSPMRVGDLARELNIAVPSGSPAARRARRVRLRRAPGRPERRAGTPGLARPQTAQGFEDVRAQGIQELAGHLASLPAAQRAAVEAALPALEALADAFTPLTEPPRALASTADEPADVAAPRRR